MNMMCSNCKKTVDSIKHMGDGTRLCEECQPDDPVYGPSHRCVLCGKKEHCTWEPKKATRLREKQICFNCDFWQNYVTKAADPNSVRVGGRHYWILPDNQTSLGTLGFGGSPFRVQFNDGRYLVSRNVWHQGDIPEHFRTQLPDNATFLPITLEWMAEQKEEKKS